jgi:hypothetical protein
MPRAQYPSISEIAQQVLREVKAEDQIKTAERQILRDVLHPQVKTDIGVDLMKLAERCRNYDDEDPEITVEDLHNFMAKCNAG